MPTRPTDDHQSPQDPAREPARASQPEVGTRYSAHEIHEMVREAAEDEMDRPALDLFWSAIAAGLGIGWSFVVGAWAQTLVPPAYDHLVATLAYPLGFAFVILGRNQLFTENTLEPVIPLLTQRSARALRRMLRLWGLVFAGNLIGALAFAALFARTDVVSGAVHAHMLDMGTSALAGTFGSQFYRAIFAGWLIALTAWLVSATQLTGAQIVLIWLTVAPISALEFRHSIAGTVETMFVALSDAASWGAVVGRFIVPAVLGNIVGGVGFVAMLNHGQVAGKRKQESEDGKGSRDDREAAAWHRSSFNPSDGTHGSGFSSR